MSSAASSALSSVELGRDEPEPLGPGFDAADYCRALAQFATGVVIVSAADPMGEPVGLTVNSFNSVSLDPPLVLFSVARTAFSLPVLARAEGYSISVLSSAHEGLSRRFGTTLGERKWAATPYVLGRFDAPLIEGALARFECRPYAVYDGGDHIIFVGRVVTFEMDERRRPLLFFRRGYHGLEDEGAMLSD